MEGAKEAICIRGLKWTSGEAGRRWRKRGNKGSREKGEREEALGRRREDQQGQALSC